MDMIAGVRLGTGRTSAEEQRLIALRVDWMEGWGNSPNWYGQVNYIQNFYTGEPIWEREGSMYRAEKGIEVEYKAYSAPGEGYGGRVFPIVLRSGEALQLRGPWSSRAACANEAFPQRERCIEVPLVEDEQAWKRGYTFRSANLKVSALIDWLRAHDFICEQKIGGSFNKKGEIITGPIRLAWQTTGRTDSEPRLLPLRADGSPKGAEYQILEEVK